MPNYGGTSSGMDDLDTWGGGTSVGNFDAGGFDMSGNADFGGYTSFGDWGGSSIDSQIADAVAGVAAASLAGGDAGGWADVSGGFGTVDIGDGGWDFGGLGDPLGGADGWGSSVADMVGGGDWGGGADLSGGFGSSIAGSIGASGFGSGGGGGGGWDLMPSGEPIATSGFSDLFTDAGRQPNMGPGVQNMSTSAFSDVPMQPAAPQAAPGSLSPSVQDMQTVANAFRSMNSQLPAGVMSQPGTPNMYGTPQELGPKIQDRISPDIANALPDLANPMEPSNPALSGFTYGNPKTDKIQDRIEPDENFQNPNIKASIPGISPDAPPDPLIDRVTSHALYGPVNTSLPAVFGVYQRPKDQSRITQKDDSRIDAGVMAQPAGKIQDRLGPAPMEYTPPDEPTMYDITPPDNRRQAAPVDLTPPAAPQTPAPPQRTLFGAPVDILSKSVRSDMNQPTDRYGNVLDVGWPGGGVDVYTDNFVAPEIKKDENKSDEDHGTTEPYPTHVYPPYYPTWPYVSGYAPGGLAPWSWFQSLYAQS